jgi:dienelactone hydrolase
MRIEAIEYSVGGQTMTGQLAVDDAQPGARPCVLVCHEAGGLSEQTKDRAVQLAALGYLTFALDYVGAGPAAADPRVRADALRADRDAIVAAAWAGLDVLLAQPGADANRVGAIGYCFGGTMVLELARSWPELRVAVGFHPSMPLPAPEATRNIRAHVLLCCGADDPYVPVEAVHAFEAELAGAGVAGWRVELYDGVGHNFTNVTSARLGAAYDEAADRHSWRAALELLAEQLGPR